MTFFKKWEAARPLCTFLDIFFFFLGWWVEYLVGYFRSAHFLGGDVCTIVTICLVIRQSGGGCPCQEGGQGTNSFLFLDTSIYQAWPHASHTLKVGLCAFVNVCFFVHVWVGWRKGERHTEMSGIMCVGERQTLGETLQVDLVDVEFPTDIKSTYF